RRGDFRIRAPVHGALWRPASGKRWRCGGDAMRRPPGPPEATAGPPSATSPGPGATTRGAAAGACPAAGPGSWPPPAPGGAVGRGEHRQAGLVGAQGNEAAPQASRHLLQLALAAHEGFAEIFPDPNIPAVENCLPAAVADRVAPRGRELRFQGGGNAGQYELVVAGVGEQ